MSRRPTITVITLGLDDLSPLLAPEQQPLAATSAHGAESRVAVDDCTSHDAGAGETSDASSQGPTTDAWHTTKDISNGANAERAYTTSPTALEAKPDGPSSSGNETAADDQTLTFALRSISSLDGLKPDAGVALQIEATGTNWIGNSISWANVTSTSQESLGIPVGLESESPATTAPALTPASAWSLETLTAAQVTFVPPTSHLPLYLAEAASDEAAPLTEPAGALNQLLNYDLNQALDAVLLSQVAYQGNTSLAQLGGWTALQPVADGPGDGAMDAFGGLKADNGFGFFSLTDGSAYAFAASHLVGDVKEYAISFAGTDFGDLGDVQSDFQTYGFTRYYEQMQPLFAEVLLQALADVRAEMDVRILITGHSLGGAVAQAAFADLLIAPNLSLWSDADAPVGLGNRLYTIEAISQSAGEIAALAAKTQVITFGAPSLLIDPYKLDSDELVAAINGASGGPVGVFTSVLESLLVKAVSWEFPAIGLNLDAFGSQMFASHYHQFELTDSAPFRGNDPVADLGPHDLGAVFEIDISEGSIDLGQRTLHDRYEELSPGFFDVAMHGSSNYRESIIRAFTNAGLTEATGLVIDPFATDSPVLPATGGGPGNDRIEVGPNPRPGGTGNDVLHTSYVGSVVPLGGDSGSDAFVIEAHGVRALISSTSSERADHLYFQLLGTPQAPEVVGNDLVFRLTHSGVPDTVVTVQGWFDPYINYQLASARQTIPADAENWYVFRNLLTGEPIPLFNEGTSGHDSIIGSTFADGAMFGGTGNDTINGRDGSDAIWGDVLSDPGDPAGGNDQLFGSEGDDTLYGGAGSDHLAGGPGADEVWGGMGGDRFVIDLLPDAAGPDRIKDYRMGMGSYSFAEADRIDLSALVGPAYAQGTGEAAGELVRALADPRTGLIDLQIDVDGAGGPLPWQIVAKLNAMPDGALIDVVMDVSAGDDIYTLRMKSAASAWSITPSSSILQEGDGSITFTITRPEASKAETVYVSTTQAFGSPNSADYVGWLDVAYTFAVGALVSEPITIAILDDTMAESTETFGLIVQAAPVPDVSMNLAAATFSVKDDDAAPGDGGFTNGDDWVLIEPVEGASALDGLLGYDTAVLDFGTAFDVVIGSNGSTGEVLVDGYLIGDINFNLTSKNIENYVFIGGQEPLSVSLWLADVDVIALGGDGDDVLYGGLGNDVIFGGGGNDLLGSWGGSGGADVYFGGDGDDTLEIQLNSAGEPLVIDGGPGFDTLFLGTGWAFAEDITLTIGDPNITSYVLPDGTVVNEIEEVGGLSTGSGNDTVTFVWSEPKFRGWEAGAGDDHAVFDFSGFSGKVDVNGSTGQYDPTPIFTVNQHQVVPAISATSYFSELESLTILGGQGNLSVYSSIDVELTVLGGSGDDSFRAEGQSGGVFLGGAGDDWATVTSLVGGPDLVDGGSGTDGLRLELSSLAESLALDLPAVVGASFVLPGGASITSVERFVVLAGSGDDNIGGGGGDDVLVGGYGDDLLRGGAGNDEVFGDDWYGSGLGGGRDWIDGGDGNDSLYGGQDDDSLFGGDGDDWLGGGSGSNALWGGLGDDSLGGGDGNDSLDGGDGHDVLYGYGGDDTLQGGAGDDLLYAYEGIDTLVGGDGNDTLDGGTGADGMAGGLGDDTYVVDDVGDVIVENWSEPGSDTAISTLAFFQIPSYVENLTLAPGVANLNGKGNWMANVLVGNDGHNLLEGANSIDTLIGGAGNDTLDGGAGADSMVGSLGDDTYVVTTMTDVIVEAVGEGYDTVRSLVTVGYYTLPDNVEALYTFLTSGNLGGIGNALDNTMVGSGSNDDFQGLDGNDSILGATGNDTLNGGNGNDTLGGGGGNDNLIGGAGDDSMSGGGGDDTLSGGAGNDTMNGGDGNDSYMNVAAGDVVAEGINQGYDRIYANGNTKLVANVEYLELLTGTSGTGNTLDNTLVGNSTYNTLSGLDGADTLVGKTGNDALYAGVDASTDRFVFDTALNAGTNVDRLYEADFPEDRILLDNSIFTALMSTDGTGTGTLGAGFYFEGIGINGNGGADAIGVWYDLVTGNLYYNPTASVGGDSVLFAIVDGASALLDSVDFTLVTQPLGVESDAEYEVADGDVFMAAVVVNPLNTSSGEAFLLM